MHTDLYITFCVCFCLLVCFVGLVGWLVGFYRILPGVTVFVYYLFSKHIITPSSLFIDLKGTKNSIMKEKKTQQLSYSGNEQNNIFVNTTFLILSATDSELRS